jgi:stage II sporulation protein D
VVAALGITLGSCATSTSEPRYVRPVPRAAGVTDANRPGQPSRGPRLETLTSEPNIRVRIVTAQPRAELGAGTSLTIGPAGGTAPETSRPRRFAAPVTLRHEAQGFLITDGQRRTVRWALPALAIRATEGQTVTLDGRAYPGLLVAVPASDRDKLDVVNHVPLETYLPGVLEKELYASWHPATFRAQAIAARSYALWERTLSPQRHYDLESTQASQVYAGSATNPRAIDAVRDTRGLVLAYRGRVVPAFYSAAHGSRMQDARYAFPNRVEDIAPLRGREVGGWDAACPRYRWGPFTRHTATLSRRIAAWGRANKHAVAALNTLRAIEISETSPTGRPAMFTLTDSTSRRYDLPPESFRFACNYRGAGIPAIAKDRLLYSSDVQATVAGGVVRFTGGQGFGHGVGLSQWGAQAMALAGHPHPAILAFYYPGSRLERAYR